MIHPGRLTWKLRIHSFGRGTSSSKPLFSGSFFTLPEANSKFAPEKMDASNTFFSFPLLGSSLLPFENQGFCPKRFGVFKKHLTEVLTTPRILQSVTLHLGETPNGKCEGNPWNQPRVGVDNGETHLRWVPSGFWDSFRRGSKVKRCNRLHRLPSLKLTWYSPWKWGPPGSLEMLIGNHPFLGANC